MDSSNGTAHQELPVEPSFGAVPKRRRSSGKHHNLLESLVHASPRNSPRDSPRDSPAGTPSGSRKQSSASEQRTDSFNDYICDSPATMTSLSSLESTPTKRSRATSLLENNDTETSGDNSSYIFAENFDLAGHGDLGIPIDSQIWDEPICASDSEEDNDTSLRDVNDNALYYGGEKLDVPSMMSAFGIQLSDNEDDDEDEETQKLQSPMPSQFSTDIPPPPVPALFSVEEMPPPPPVPTAFSDIGDLPPPPPPQPATFSTLDIPPPPVPAQFSTLSPQPSAQQYGNESPATARKKVSHSTDYRKKYGTSGADWTGDEVSLRSYDSGYGGGGELSRSGSGAAAGYGGMRGRARSATQEEYVYSLVLQSAINPLGAPDQRPGYTPRDLAEHIRKVFGVERDRHETIVKDVQHKRPSTVVLDVSVLEAKDLTAPPKNGSCDPYVVLGVSSPRPAGSAAPAAATRKHSSLDASDVKRTQAIKGSVAPRWNETFEMDVKDVSSDALQLMVFSSEEVTARTDGGSKGVKGLFKQLKSSLDSGKLSGGAYQGQARIPVKDIPASGWERWFPLYKDTSQKTKAGAVRLRLGLSVRKDPLQLEAAEADTCSVDDFYQVARRLYHAAAGEGDKAQQASHSAVFGELPEASRNVFHQFAVQNRFSKLQQLLMELIVILELASSAHVAVGDAPIKAAIVNLEQEWFQAAAGGGGGDRTLVSEAQFLLFNKSATEYISRMIKGLKETHAIPPLFPPHQLKLAELNKKVSVAVSLLNLHLWTTTDRAKKDASGLLADRLQDDVKQWINSKLDNIDQHMSNKEPELDESRLLVEIIDDCCTALTPMFSVDQYFRRLNIDYFKITSVAIDKELCARCQQLMQRMDRYQVRYHKFPVNIRDSSGASLQLYFALRRFLKVVKENISGRDTDASAELFLVTIARYQNWFEHAVMFWLQTFREECVRRMGKALEIDKDVVQVTSLVKYSNSCVDVKSCFSKISSEWQQIDFEDADISVLGVTKITDTICDGAKAYVEQIHTILENNGYYDFNEDEVFDVTDQLCITLNNIVQVRQFLLELPALLHWHLVCSNMAVKHESDAVGQQSLRVLQQLVESADEEILVRGKILLRNITDKMAVDIRKLTRRFTVKQPEKMSSVDPLIGYLDTSLDTLYEKLEDTVFPLMLEQIWHSMLAQFRDTLLQGQNNEYYRHMNVHLSTLQAYVLRGVSEETAHCPEYRRLAAELQLSAMPTDSLLAEYYSTLTQDTAKTPGNYFGHLAVKMAYRVTEEDDTKVEVIIKVDSGSRLPGMRRDDLCDPYVTVQLSPAGLFPSVGSKGRGLRTRTAHDTINPDYGETFTVTDVDVSCVQEPGPVAIFTVWNHETILPDDFLGELVLPLGDAAQLRGKQTLEDAGAMILPLQRRTEPKDGAWQVLKARASHDKYTKGVVKQRSETAGWDKGNPLCAPFISVISKVKGKKTTVEGQKYGPTI